MSRENSTHHGRNIGRIGALVAAGAFVASGCTITPDGGIKIGGGFVGGNEQPTPRATFALLDPVPTPTADVPRLLTPRPTLEVTPAPVSSEQPTTIEGLGRQIANPVPVPDVISGGMVRELRRGGQNPMYSEGEWFHPVYDLTQESAREDYRGIGPWYPVAYENLDANAAVLTTHGNVGEVVVSGREGGMVMVAFMQLDAHQDDGSWGTNPRTGRFEQNGRWEMQYNMHSLQPLQEIWVVDPDTGKNSLWPDGSPVIYRANDKGIAAFEIPATHGNDVRVGFVFEMPGQGNRNQAPEVKIERGPNDNPSRKGENPLPDSVIKPMVAER